MGAQSLFVGLISGTSVDGIDAALVGFEGRGPQREPSPTLLAHHHHPYPEGMREALLALCHADAPSIHHLFTMDAQVGGVFAEAVHELLAIGRKRPDEIRAVGSHGQTIRHHPHGPTPYTVQIGDANIIAQRTGITTVADLRRRDVAAGGQGAPLAPAFHAAVLRHPERARAIVNIGGIANVTFLDPGSSTVLAFDCGPGNGLMDAWIRATRDLPYDDQGHWAREGTVDAAALRALEGDQYFSRSAPKSTGPEYFNLAWVERRLSALARPEAADLQRTLCELTASTIVRAIAHHPRRIEEVLVCGGGAHNTLLMERLMARCNQPAGATRRDPCRVDTTHHEGVDPDWVEAMAFAWLAKRTLAGKAGNHPSVTGASEAVVLGAIYPGRTGSR